METKRLGRGPGEAAGSQQTPAPQLPAPRAHGSLAPQPRAHGSLAPLHTFSTSSSPRLAVSALAAPSGGATPHPQRYF